MPGFGERAFGNDQRPVGSTGDSRTPVPNDAVPVQGVYGATQVGDTQLVSPSWVQHGIRKDHGLCVRCARSGGKGRRKAGSTLCTPHLIQDARRAAKTAE